MSVPFFLKIFFSFLEIGSTIHRNIPGAVAVLPPLSLRPLCTDAGTGLRRVVLSSAVRHVALSPDLRVTTANCNIESSSPKQSGLLAKCIPRITQSSSRSPSSISINQTSNGFLKSLAKESFAADSEIKPTAQSLVNASSEALVTSVPPSLCSTYNLATSSSPPPPPQRHSSHLSPQHPAPLTIRLPEKNQSFSETMVTSNDTDKQQSPHYLITLANVNSKCPTSDSISIPTLPSNSGNPGPKLCKYDATVPLSHALNHEEKLVSENTNGEQYSGSKIRVFQHLGVNQEMLGLELNGDQSSATLLTSQNRSKYVFSLFYVTSYLCLLCLVIVQLMLFFISCAFNSRIITFYSEL
ncbi:unnamed protein product [Protopolystoma xenopodis]|uniref:Uncharacterized protein n=1 Tax=Protopolystoma xenopodis TaxID=117903 RepID=A0A448XIS0_9PLAT|nr:unnamed protein product [Protopolystoma xenopodis]